MKQLFIVTDPSAIATSVAGASVGQLIMEVLEITANQEPTNVLNIGLATDKGARLIEVNPKWSRVTITQPSDASSYSATCVVPTPTDATDYTLVLVKKGATANERFKWTATDYVPAGVVKSADAIANSLGKQLYEKTEQFGIEVVYPSADGSSWYKNGAAFTPSETLEAGTIMVDCPAGELWTLVGGDALAGLVTVEDEAAPAIGDVAYLKNLASQCAAGKGFNYTDGDGKDIYPGYPEPINSSDAPWAIINIRFATFRVSGHQTDEPIYQYLHIAIPSTALDTFMAFLEPVFGSNVVGEVADADGDNDEQG